MKKLVFSGDSPYEGCATHRYSDCRWRAFLVVNGLFSAWALLELGWSTILSFVNLF
jgi:hypothetical protein